MLSASSSVMSWKGKRSVSKFMYFISFGTCALAFSCGISGMGKLSAIASNTSLYLIGHMTEQMSTSFSFETLRKKGMSISNNI